MFNPTVYGKSSSAPHMGVLGVSGIDWNQIIKEGEEKLKEATGENITIPELPSNGIAKEIGGELAEVHGEAVGKGAAQELKPFVTVGLMVLGGIFLLMVFKKRK